MNNPAPNSSGFVVVTHVYPQQVAGAHNAVSPTTTEPSQPCTPLGKFLKGEPAALGTVQIMIGIFIFLFGIVSCYYPVTVSVFSGIVFWGAIIHIIAGSLTVKASKKLIPCLVKASLGMNVVSTIASGIAIVLYSLDFVVPTYPYISCYDNYENDSDYIYDCRRSWESFMSRALGISGVMLLLSLLEFIVSIYVSAFACKATCCSNTDLPVVYVSGQVPPSVPATHTSSPTMCQPEAPFLAPGEVFPLSPNSPAPAVMDSKPTDLPPAYTDTQG